MSISETPSGGGLSGISWQNAVRQRQQDFLSLAAALRSGDLQKAQQSFSALQQMRQNVQSVVGPANRNNPLTDDWMAIGRALDSRNLDEARTAFDRLQQDVQAIQHSPHRRHHLPGPQPVGGEARTGSGESVMTTPNEQTSGNLIDISA